MNRLILGALCDLDGVITKTAKIHAQAWKQMFDQFFRRYDQKLLQHHIFDIALDYPLYIDGKPRMEAIQDYLQSKKIIIAMGNEGDKDKDTVHGLAYQKNKIYLEFLENHCIQIYQENVHQLRKWKSQGMQLAVVSSSRNCQHILELVKLSALFKICVDGLTAEQEHLRGKPHPDIFLFAAKELKISPGSLMVIEDAAAGIKAAEDGKFGLCVGIIRSNNRKYIQKTSPDTEVADLRELDWVGKHIRFPTKCQNLFNLGIHFKKLSTGLAGRKIAILLDYDGTLAPTISHTEDAIISTGMRQTLSNLSELTKVIIISGRDNYVLQKFIKLSNLLYVGNYGLDLVIPGKTDLIKQKMAPFLPYLQEIQKELLPKLTTISGIEIEPKKYSLAIHYHNVAKQDERKVIEIIQHAVHKHSKLKIFQDKMVLNILPNIDWDKGKALKFILSALDLVHSEICPIYLGDDLTDEKAFRSLPEQGIGILIGENRQRTYADFRLNNKNEVEKFLYNLTRMIKQHG